MKNNYTIEDYNRRLELSNKEEQDEKWFREAILEISDGTFSCYGQGRHLSQNKDCNWHTIYRLLDQLECVNATIRLNVTIDSFNELAEEYKTYKKIREAIKNGWIKMDATMTKEKSVQLYCCLDWDIGDSGNYGRWTINLMAYLDEQGNFIKPFFVQDTRMR